MEIIQSPAPGASIEEVTRKVQQLCNLVNKLVSNVPVDSTAADVPGVVTDINALLAVLRALNGK